MSFLCSKPLCDFLFFSDVLGAASNPLALQAWRQGSVPPPREPGPEGVEVTPCF